MPDLFKKFVNQIEDLVHPAAEPTFPKHVGTGLVVFMNPMALPWWPPK